VYPLLVEALATVGTLDNQQGMLSLPYVVSQTGWGAALHLKASAAISSHLSLLFFSSSFLCYLLLCPLPQPPE
jgi:hypothetical protein